MNPTMRSAKVAEQLLRDPTEQNVALAFAVLHRDRLRFCAQRGCWYELPMVLFSAPSNYWPGARLRIQTCA